MISYSAPITEMLFVMSEIGGFNDIKGFPDYDGISLELTQTILEEANKLGTEVLLPLNHSGDIDGCTFENGIVNSPTGFKTAYDQFVKNGWNSAPFSKKDGGQGLPWLIATSISEIWNSANMAFGVCPLLNQGAIELLKTHGTSDLKAKYLPKLVSGEWTGTMNLTEPQAGSDLSLINTKAIPMGQEYRLFGQKIYVSYGDHDLTENIIHMVLARLPNAPEGVKGISLFLVPKFLNTNQSSVGERNDIRCASIERKLGIKGSPTAVMLFGENNGAVGFLVGERHCGLKCMFTMMNNARLTVGLQGVAIAERAYQQARNFAFHRTQGRLPGCVKTEPISIVNHLDVKRMLLSMKVQAEVTRALAYYVAGKIDTAKRHPNKSERHKAQARVDLLTPVVKAWGTDCGFDAASTGIQIHGGMGYIEETGAAQHLRDARIGQIYEGTNGIQANDLVYRKVMYDKGNAMGKLICEIKDFIRLPSNTHSQHTLVLIKHLRVGIDALARSTDWIIKNFKDNTKYNSRTGSAVHYLKLVGLVSGGWLMAKAAVAAENRRKGSPTDFTFLDSKLVSCRFFADHFLVEAPILTEILLNGDAALHSLNDDYL